jgi:hypothetical protein
VQCMYKMVSISGLVITSYLQRSSSVLHRNVTLYGPNNALDIANPSSCWNSDTSNQHHTYQIQFHRNVQVHQIKFTCQGGFVPQKVCVNDQLLELIDTNQVQDFYLTTTPCHTLTLTLQDSTDFYGRITIYNIEVWGWEEDEKEN